MRPSLPLTFLLATLAASQLGATDDGGCAPGEVLRDEGFDLWCGETLCAWKVVSGTIVKAPTWHEGDAGVEFLGDEAIIEQVSPVTRNDTSCIRFEMLANVAENAEVTLGIDFAADRHTEHVERIPTSTWKPITFLLRIDDSFSGIRFELAKRGAGHAMLAQILATVAPASDCAGFTPLLPMRQPAGAWCTENYSCASEMCRNIPDDTEWLGFRRICVECDPAAPVCGAGEVCGYGDQFSFVRELPIECVPIAGDELGEQCLAGDQCASGICSTDGYCSSCDAAQPCATGGCRLAYPSGPRTCAAGAAGAACASDDDCASGQCAGATRKQCADGRACTSPDQCPPEDPTSLEPGACTLVGVQGGTCQ